MVLQIRSTVAPVFTLKPRTIMRKLQVAIIVALASVVNLSSGETNISILRDLLSHLAGIKNELHNITRIVNQLQENDSKRKGQMDMIELDTIPKGPQDCRCSNIHMRKSSCARLYLERDCNTCNAYYTELKGSEEYFSNEFGNSISSVVVRPGCKLIVYNDDDERFLGNSTTFEGIVESWNPIQTVSSYECTCSNDQHLSVIKKASSPDYPKWIDVPKGLAEMNKMRNGENEDHPALLAALKSSKHRRSSRNAYILLIGTSGSGKSSTINSLFDQDLTSVSGTASITSAINEYSVPVRVDELGLANSELRIIDTPGLGDTRGFEQDATFLARLDDYLSNQEDLKDKIPNVVLVFHRFQDNRFTERSSTFVKMLRGFESLLPKITDQNYSNVIFVFTHFSSETKKIQSCPNARLESFKNVIERYNMFPKPINLVVAENKGKEQELPLVNGYFQLPNGEFFPRNIFDKIQLVTSKGGDPIGGAIITAAFRKSEELHFSQTTYIFRAGSPKIPQYLNMLRRNANEKIRKSKLPIPEFREDIVFTQKEETTQLSFVDFMSKIMAESRKIDEGLETCKN